MDKSKFLTRDQMIKLGWNNEAIKAMESLWGDAKQSLPAGIASATGLANTANNNAVIADGKAVTADNKAVIADSKAVAADSKAVAATNSIQVEKPTTATPTIDVNSVFKLTLSLKPTLLTLTSCIFNLPAPIGLGHTISITTTKPITTVTFSPLVTGSPSTMAANQSFKFTWDGDEWITIL